MARSVTEDDLNRLGVEQIMALMVQLSITPPHDSQGKPTASKEAMIKMILDHQSGNCVSCGQQNRGGYTVTIKGSRQAYNSGLAAPVPCKTCGKR